MRYDVIVAGLGPGGATAAYELGRAGLGVLALDKKGFPRYKPCGGGLSARIGMLLSPDFHSTVDTTIRAIRFCYPGKEDFTVYAQDPIAFMVTRERFDHHLMLKAKAGGAEIRQQEALLKINETEEGVEVTTSEAQYKATVLVGADGAHSLAARTLNPCLCRRKILALEEEIPLDGIDTTPRPDEVFIDLGASPGGYAWGFPKMTHVSAGIAGFSGQKRSLLNQFSNFKASRNLDQRMAGQRLLGYPLPVFDHQQLRLASRRVVLLGDAANLVDPFMGEGIYYAIRSGQIAARSVTAAIRSRAVDCSPYQDCIARELYPEFIAAGKLARISYAFPQLWYEGMQRYPEVTRWFYEILQGLEDYPGLLVRLKSQLGRLLKNSIRDKIGGVLKKSLA